MNRIEGLIEEIQISGILSLIRVRANERLFSSILIDDQKTRKIGDKVQLIFKENELFLANGQAEGISIQNRFPSIVNSIERGDLLSRVRMKFGQYELSSVITTRAVEQLELKEGKEILALLKTNELLLE